MDAEDGNAGIRDPTQCLLTCLGGVSLEPGRFDADAWTTLLERAAGLHMSQVAICAQTVRLVFSSRQLGAAALTVLWRAHICCIVPLDEFFFLMSTGKVTAETNDILRRRFARGEQEQARSK